MSHQTVDSLGILERYREQFDFLPDDPAAIVTLKEGNTPLIPAPALSRYIASQYGVADLDIHLKFEGLNPTGSFKDRGMTAAVTMAKAQGASHIICASTGNTSASAAAYGARAGLTTLVVIPQGKIAAGKLAQAIAYGATIVEIDGNFDDALKIVRELGDAHVAIVNSINPYRIEGQKSAAFEVCEQLGNRAPDRLYIPVGNAGNITAYWAGFKAYQQAGKINQLPQLHGFEAEGAAAIVRNEVIAQPETIATAIRIGNPASWQGALAARDESQGSIGCVSDAAILAAWQRLTQGDGVFCEPSSAASVAGLLQAAEAGTLHAGQTIVCVLTGNGLKDSDTVISDITATRLKARPVEAEVRQLLSL